MTFIPVLSRPDSWIDRIAEWDDTKADSAIRRGLPVESAIYLQSLLQLSKEETARLNGRSRNTYARYRNRDTELNSSEVKRVVRCARSCIAGRGDPERAECGHHVDERSESPSRWAFAATGGRNRCQHTHRAGSTRGNSVWPHCLSAHFVSSLQIDKKQRPPSLVTHWQVDRL